MGVKKHEYGAQSKLVNCNGENFETVGLLYNACMMAFVILTVVTMT